MKSHTDYLWFDTEGRRDLINITRPRDRSSVNPPTRR